MIGEDEALGGGYRVRQGTLRMQEHDSWTRRCVISTTQRTAGTATLSTSPGPWSYMGPTSPSQKGKAGITQQRARQTRGWHSCPTFFAISNSYPEPEAFARTPASQIAPILTQELGELGS
jgi:hypothetical protein